MHHPRCLDLVELDIDALETGELLGDVGLLASWPDTRENAAPLLEPAAACKGLLEQPGNGVYQHFPAAIRCGPCEFGFVLGKQQSQSADRQLIGKTHMIG
jgi:hypothetical protein